MRYTGTEVSPMRENIGSEGAATVIGLRIPEQYNILGGEECD